MTLDRSKVFSLAWTIAKQDQWSARAKSPVPFFAAALKSAWKEIKRRAVIAAQRAKEASRPSADIWVDIQNLENRDRLGHEGINRLAELRTAYDEALKREAEEKAAAELAEKRNLIESAKGQFISVAFTKKDGSERVMRIQPAKLKFHVKGESASEAAKRAVETRKARHPHLLPVWDVEASAPRSVNLATISRITLKGHIHEYRQ